MLNKINSHIFRGKKYKITFSPVDKDIKRLAPKSLATCDSPKIKDKTITIDPSAHGLVLLKLAIDEGIHACVWDFDNSSVDEMADSISRFVYRIGFRELRQLNKKIIKDKKQ